MMKHDIQPVNNRVPFSFPLNWGECRSVRVQTASNKQISLMLISRRFTITSKLLISLAIVNKWQHPEPCTTIWFQYTQDVFCYLASLTLTLAIRISGHTKLVINLLSQLLSLLAGEQLYNIVLKGCTLSTMFAKTATMLIKFSLFEGEF